MTIRLEGTWLVRLDKKRQGIENKFFLEDFSTDVFPVKITLPGSLEENGIGDLVCSRDTGNVNRTFSYGGWAWYQRVIDFGPTPFKHMKLSLARVCWESTLWIDGECLGSFCSLSAPHTYDLSPLSLSGKHTVTIMIDNSDTATDTPAYLDTEVFRGGDGEDAKLKLRTVEPGKAKIPCGGHGTANGNGVIGEMKIDAENDPITSLNVYPDIGKEEILVRIGKESETADKIGFALELDGKVISKTALELNEKGEYRLPVTPCRLWSEFTPVLYTLTVTLMRGDEALSSRSVRFGMRELTTKGRKLMINGHQLYLRGTLEGVAFPETGYMPSDKEFWRHAFSVMKEYGLNHMRCHTFCPPEEAFEAADEMGIYLQPELPGTSCPENPERQVVADFLMTELKRILDAFGNHPSFCTISMGNEQLTGGSQEFLTSHTKVLEEKVHFGQKYDPRHLYTATSHPYSGGRDDDFYVSAGNRAGYGAKAINGITWGGPDPRFCSRFCTDRPSLDYVYTAANEIDKPVISHEVGQWAVYPDFREAARFRGLEHPGNYEIIYRSLCDHRLGDLAYPFMMASGKLSYELYKEEIESALRTEALTGFQLLDIHDYPGQGTSTVGILNVFWESKGLCTPEEFRGFCSDVVPLLVTNKRVFENNETPEAEVKIANYSGKDTCAPLTVTAENDGKVIFRNEYADVKTAPDGLTTVCRFTWDLSVISDPVCLKVTCTYGDRVNSWKIWVYPHESDVTSDDIVIAAEMDNKTTELLESGKDVLLLASASANGSKGSMTTVFWNPFMKKQDGWMGLLCDVKSHVFDDFPTDYHSDWQWWDIVMRSRAMILDGIPELDPLVRVIDSIKDNRSLALMFEARVGRGRILVCSADLLNAPENNPASRQLLRSIYRYMKSDKFDPKLSTYPLRIRRILIGQA